MKSSLTFLRMDGSPAVRMLSLVILAAAFSKCWGAETGPLDPSGSLENKIRRLPIFSERIRWVGSVRPAEPENAALWDSLQRAPRSKEGLGAIERFLEAHPNSAWAASLHSNLALDYREHGFYTRALRHWERAWELTKSYAEGDGKRVADYALAHWAKFLSSLGRVEELDRLFEETRGRYLDRGPLQQMFNTTREAVSIMKMDPGVAYRCGTFAVHRLGQLLQGGNYASRGQILGQKSPTNGFSVSELVAIARSQGLDLVPVRREGTNLIVPSIVHLKLNHYAAITAETNGYYKVEDPTFGTIRGLSREAIDEEASGLFLVPARQVPSPWKRLEVSETDRVFGKGYPTTMPDAWDRPRRPDICGPTPDGRGVPAWWVSEPYLSLWFEMTPLSYQPARGERMNLNLTWKQRGTDPVPDYPNFGNLWNASWWSYLEHATSPAFTYWKAYLPGGGMLDYIADGQTVQYLNNTRLKTVVEGGVTNRLEMYYPDGQVHKYGFVVSDYQYGGPGHAFLTEMVDARGRSVILNYDTNLFQSDARIRLLSVVDRDGGTNRLLYTTNISENLIAAVVDPKGNTNTFSYDQNDSLTSAVDGMGNAASFSYDDNGFVTTLITPYGTNSFSESVGGAMTRALNLTCYRFF